MRRHHQAHGARGGDIGGVLGAVETDPDMALGPQVIDLVGLEVVQQIRERIDIAGFERFIE